MALNTQSLFQTLQLDLAQLDDERIQARNKIVIRSLIHVPTILLGISVWFWTISEDAKGLGFLTVIVTLGLFMWWLARISAVRKEFAKSFKEKLIKRIIAKMDPGFTYQPDNQKHKLADSNPLVTQINNSLILPKYHTAWTEDVISGTVRDNKFDFMELKMEDGTGKQRRTVFQGILLAVQLKSSFPSNIYIRPDYGNQMFSGLAKMFNMYKHRGKQIKVNHPEFERLFDVYADDDQTAAMVLTNQVLDRLLKIHQKITEMSGIKNSISFSFVQNTITIAVRLTTNLFEPRILKPINDIAYFESNANYLVLFLGLIEDLNVSR